MEILCSFMIWYSEPSEGSELEGIVWFIIWSVCMLLDLCQYAYTIWIMYGLHYWWGQLFSLEILLPKIWKFIAVYDDIMLILYFETSAASHIQWRLIGEFMMCYCSLWLFFWMQGLLEYDFNFNSLGCCLGYSFQPGIHMNSLWTFVSFDLLWSLTQIVINI